MIQVSPEQNSTAVPPTMYCALELSEKNWKVAFSAGDLVVKLKTVPARNLEALFEALAWAKKKLRLPEEARLVSCYEASRDGFWLHRALNDSGVENVVIDPTSLQVDQRQRRVKTDRIDAHRMVAALIRYHRGEKALRVVRIPSRQQEDGRRPSRERERLVSERTRHKNRIRSLLFLHGINLKVTANVREALDQLRSPAGEPLPPRLREEIKREFDRMLQVEQQLTELKKQQSEELKNDRSPMAQMVATLMQLRGIGNVSASVLVTEMFGWREFRNRRQVAAVAGMAPSPYNSGNMERDQGISKAGRKQIRALMVELAWSWLRFQQDSKLSQWFLERFGGGNGRMRRIGIVAMARRLLIDLWRLASQGVVPEGAVMKAV